MPDSTRFPHTLCGPPSCPESIPERVEGVAESAFGQPSQTAILGVVLLIALLLMLLIPGVLLAQTTDHRAGLVVQFGDARVDSVCVHFSEDQISGEELLRRAGLPVVVQGGSLGAAVCQIDGQGCAFPKEPCFCKCQGADCTYWSLQQQVDGAWHYANQGASSVEVRDGDVYGWAWGAGSVASGAAPPLRSFAEICAVAAAPTTAPTSVLIAPPTTAQPTSAPLPTVTPKIEVGSSPGKPASYIAFVVIVCVLGALFLFVRYRRRSNRRRSNPNE